MLARCYDPTNREYVRYGARGIVVCNQWRNSFEAFAADMGNPPTAAHQIDRRDNDGNYTPENCSWVLPAQQSRNRRSNIWITDTDGRTQCVLDWAKELGLNRKTLTHRLRRGWAHTDVLHRPIQLKNLGKKLLAQRLAAQPKGH